MQTQRGSTTSGSSQWPKSHQQSSGSQTHRPTARGEWSKPTSIHSSKPLNLHRSIDTKPLSKKNDHLSNINVSGTVNNNQQFLFSTYSSGTMSNKNSSLENSQTRHLSIKGWNNTAAPLPSQNQQNQILKNLLLQNHSNTSIAVSSQNKTIKSSSSSSSLLMDSAIRKGNSINQNSSSSALDKKSMNSTILSNSSGKPKVFNDLQNALNTQSIKGKQKIDLASILQQFAPPQSTKSLKGSKKSQSSNEKCSGNGKYRQNALRGVKQENLQSIFEKATRENRQDAKVYSSNEDDVQMHLEQVTPRVGGDSDVEHHDDNDDVNESVVVFKQTTTNQAKSQDPTPKSGSLISYSGPSSSDKAQDKLDFLPMNKVNKESRNQLHPMYLSHHVQNEIPLINQNVMSSKTSQSSSSSSSGQKEVIVITEKRGSANKKANKGKVKENQPELPQKVAPKTPSDVFQYKLKSPFQATMRLDQMMKGQVPSGPQSKVSSSRQTNITKKSLVSGKENSAKGSVIVSKPPIAQNKNDTATGSSLNKSESQEVFYSKKYSDSTQFADIDNIQANFMYSTQQICPPNSNALETPVTDNQRQPSQEPITIPLEDQKFTKFDYDIRDDKQSIKVVARFRPLTSVQQEVHDINYKNSDIIHFFEDDKTVKVKEEYYSHSNNLVFTFDHVFQPSTTQEEVFNLVGKQTIEDIMMGYNGTIFAYGQTGSGKTYTMYGQDIFDEYLMGVVPRAARQIFNHIRNQDLEIEYQIRIQMVEIYKETLRDLLHDSPEQPPDLKIKEDPKRGTYVEGLTDVCIVSEEEIMTVLCTGETMRHVASTNLNKLSSRSHSICIIEIIQKYPNDSEKRGILNLVDLAGSERVSKSQAQGQALEEAKKINFSLSMLGKVINCLTKNSSYIPYRDSKLTRLLKESLGGNNKTSLIVACSLHESNIEETVSSLRFAQSAKFIQNKIKMNLKTSPEHLQIIIEQLKQELRSAKEEICRLRITSANQTNQQQNQQTNSLEYSKQEELLFQNGLELEHQLQIETESYSEEKQLIQRAKIFESAYTLHNRPHQSLLAKNYDVIETNNQRIQMMSLLSSEFSSIPGGNGTPNFTSPVKNYEVKLLQLLNRNEDLEMKLISKDKDNEALKQSKEELCSKVTQLEDKIINYKQKLVVIEKRVAEFESDKDFMIINEAKQTHMLEGYQSQIEVLTQQVRCLERALEDSEMNVQTLLKDKQQMLSKSMKDFMNDTLKVMRVPVSQALDNFINKQKDINSLHSFIKQLDLEQDYDNQEKLLQNAEYTISLKDQDLLSQNLYSLELVNAVEDNSIPPELTVYLLKNLIIDASLANYNLQRIMAVNRWRQVIEFGKYKMKSEQCKIQENTIETLEQILEKSRKTHDKLRARVDKLENHLYDNRNYYGDIVLMTEGNNQQQDATSKEMQRDIKMFQYQREKHNQNISLVIGNSCQQNQKSRFIKTITNKTLGKVFNFIEKSPMSRASLGPNQSILSQYYGQKHNPNYKKVSTPMRTGGLNSPVLFNFQSPIRRQNTMAYKMNQPQIISQNEQPQITQRNEGDQMTFEDAIVKFFNSGQGEHEGGKVKDTLYECGRYFLTLDDLQKIEGLESLQDLKDFIKQKFEKQHQTTHHNALFVQYQNNAAFHNQSNNLQSSQGENPQINSHTTNNNLYAQSNDFYDNQGPSSAKGLPCSTSGNFHDNQRQEHVMTLASDYMITSNSVIGPGNLFSNGPLGQGGNQYYQNEYIDRLQEKIVQLQEEVETQKCRAEEHKKAYYEGKRQIEVMRNLMEDKEVKYSIIMRKEVVQWESTILKLKEMSENELMRKQKEIEQLHELLAQWIDHYQELEINRGIKPMELEKLLVETLRHKRNRSGLLGELMRTPHQQTNRMFQHQGSTTMQTQQDQRSLKLYSGISASMQSLNLQTEQNPAIIYMTQQSYSNAISKELNFDKKRIKGDTSPIPQEDSCFDMDQSMQLKVPHDTSESRIELNLQTYESV